MAESPSAQELVDRAQRDDRGAFDRLAAANEDRLRRFIASWGKLHIGPGIDADEVRQETFARAFEAIARFEWQGEASFFQWLCGIAKHVLLKAAEKSQRRERLETGVEVPASGTSPSKARRREERLERLQRSIDDLPPDYRRVIQLSRIEGLKLEEVAKRLGRSRDSVKHLLARALASLRAGFGETDSLHLPDRGLHFEWKDHVER